MRSQEQVEAMLKKFDAAFDENGLDSAANAARDALIWVLCAMDDRSLEQHLPERLDNN